MIHPETVLAIVLMAIGTYATRVGGYLLFAGRAPSSRTLAVMEAAPGCVLVAVIAPAFSTGRPADLVALALTGLAATRLRLLPTFVIGVASAGVLRTLLPAYGG